MPRLKRKPKVPRASPSDVTHSNSASWKSKKRPAHGYRHLKRLSFAENATVPSSLRHLPSTRARSVASSASGMASLHAPSSKSGSESTPSDRRSVARATAAHANEFECVIEPTNPGGQIGARSRLTPTVKSGAPASISACAAHFRPAANSWSRFSRPRGAHGPPAGSHTSFVARARTNGPTIEGGLAHARPRMLRDAIKGNCRMIRNSPAECRSLAAPRAPLSRPNNVHCAGSNGVSQRALPKDSEPTECDVRRLGLSELLGR